MTSKYQLDVSQLEPCEPLERILATLPQLQTGEYLHVLHRMEPYPLYSILEKEGYTWLTQAGQEVPIEIYIWRSTDTLAAAAIKDRQAGQPL
ncbi:MAG: Clp protease ClpB [Gammaproteobacteria bacterium]|nr:MAG: Clp protease ClpB [Gammaproteobacteria bacterium]RKZ43493.1 MAG: Clp protease ClpB [Gammaproteobacteria bacterium]RKZ73977.1 MAG: Clp protease ClpB [Gammaproteobacteria bacterium]